MHIDNFFPGHHHLKIPFKFHLVGALKNYEFFDIARLCYSLLQSRQQSHDKYLYKGTKPHPREQTDRQIMEKINFCFFNTCSNIQYFRIFYLKNCFLLLFMVFFYYYFLFSSFQVECE